MRKKPIGIRPMKGVGGLLCRRACKNDMSGVNLDIGPVSELVIEPRKNMNTSDINEVGMRTYYHLLPTGVIGRHLVQNATVPMVHPINDKPSGRLLSPPSHRLVAQPNPYFASLRHTVHHVNRTRDLVEFGKVLQIEVGRCAFTRVAEVSESVGKYVLEPSTVSIERRD